MVMQCALTSALYDQMQTIQGKAQVFLVACLCEALPPNVLIQLPVQKFVGIRNDSTGLGIWAIHHAS